MTAIKMQHHLQDLEAERALASIEGLAEDPAYMDDLREEIEVTRNAYVVAAVTEIAAVRADLSGPLSG